MTLIMIQITLHESDRNNIKEIKISVNAEIKKEDAEVYPSQTQRFIIQNGGRDYQSMQGFVNQKEGKYLSIQMQRLTNRNTERDYQSKWR